MSYVLRLYCAGNKKKTCSSSSRRWNNRPAQQTTSSKKQAAQRGGKSSGQSIIYLTQSNTPPSGCLCLKSVKIRIVFFVLSSQELPGAIQSTTSIVVLCIFHFCFLRSIITRHKQQPQTTTTTTATAERDWELPRVCCVTRNLPVFLVEQ